jgi:type II secretory pathway component PulF
VKLAYEAYDKSGKVVKNTIDAKDSTEATESLRRQGLFVTNLKPATSVKGSGAGATGSGSRSKKVGQGKRLKHLAVFMRQLYVLVSTGTPLVEGIMSIERQTKDKYWKHVVGRVRQRVEEGTTLADAMSEFPEYFDPICQSLVEAGETAGKLPMMLDRLAMVTRKQQHLRSSVIGAMVYPAMLLVVAVGVLGLMLMFVLPRFGGLFETLDMPLPPTTQVLMMLSAFLLAYWWSVPIMAAAAFFGFRFWLTTPSGVYAVHTMAVRMPGLGKITRSFATARIARLMGILLESFLPLLDVLALVRESTPNMHYRNLLGKAEAAVTRGEPISAAFKDTNLINPTVYEALRSGESSGQVGPLLLNVATFLDEDNEVVVKSLTSIIEPMILIVLGALVGFVAVSMFLPLFDMTAMAGAH